jgi:hypothetical protein
VNPVVISGISNVVREIEGEGVLPHPGPFIALLLLLQHYVIFIFYAAFINAYAVPSFNKSFKNSVLCFYFI